jgi:nickel/cobalt transporter (NicO) family protein
MELFPILGAALMLGAIHTFDPDHLVAVTAFAARRPKPRRAVAYGFQWAVGHGAAVIVAGTALIALRLAMPEAADGWLERVVGLSLVALGIWTMRAARARHRHQHADGSVHGHDHAPHHAPAPHAGAVTAFGALHGLAGSAAVLALLPLAYIESAAHGVAYLAAFALGTAAAMTLYSLFFGVLAERFAERSSLVARWLTRFAGVASIVVGVIWLLG